MKTAAKSGVYRKQFALAEFAPAIAKAILGGWRLGHMTARRLSIEGQYGLVVVMIAPDSPKIQVWETDLPVGTSTFPSITRNVPSAHWFERYIYDLFGLRPEGHPRFKSVIFHECWPEGFYPLTAVEDKPSIAAGHLHEFGFLPVHGEGVFEIAVGPVHAGIIEPGHFRFSCLGEEIQNLDIRLGYVHRGVEKRLEHMGLAKAAGLASSVATDTTVGNSLAHALAVESLLGLEVGEPAVSLRAAALEIERTACHIGDIGAVCGDIGFYGGAALFGRMRGRVLGIAERLTGSRFMSSFVIPGRVRCNLSEQLRKEIIEETQAVRKAFIDTESALMDNFGALERMEDMGKLRPALAKDLGIVGPCGRASNVAYDVRSHLNKEPYISAGWQPAMAESGDVLARIRIKFIEVIESLKVVEYVFQSLNISDISSKAITFDLSIILSNQCGVGIVESWRGELIHTIFTDSSGQISRYAIKDPSTNNWPGLAHAIRGEQVTDFPLCNKSFGLSYSGNDL